MERRLSSELWVENARSSVTSSKVTRVSYREKEEFCCKGAQKWDGIEMEKCGEPKRCHQDQRVRRLTRSLPCGGRDSVRQQDAG